MTNTQIAFLLGLAYLAGTLCNRFIVARISPMKVVLIGIIGAILMAFNLIILSFIIKMNLYVVVIPIWFLFFFIGFILPNMAAKCVRLFPQMAGTASAIYGSVVAGGVFIFSILVILIKTNTQKYLAITYFMMLIVALLFFLLSERKK